MSDPVRVPKWVDTAELEKYKLSAIMRERERDILARDLENVVVDLMEVIRALREEEE
jgi:hypothetical protein